MNEQQAFRAIRNAIRLEHLSDDLANRVNPELRAIFQELGQQFKAMPPGSIEREVWYRQVRAQIGSIFAPLSEEMRDAVTDALDKEAVEQMRYAEKYLSDGMRQEGLTVRAPQEGFSQLEFGNPQFTRQQLHTIAQDTRVLGDRMGDLFRPSLDEGGKWGKWIEQNLSLVDRKVKAGFLTGMTNEQIAATLPGAGREAVVRNKAIARTAVMDMSARSQEAFWAANSDRIRGFEVDATMDNRVCDVCAPWDGEFSEVRGKLPVMPLHINCRCRVLPLTATELALRKEEGPQRRSVVELIDAPSKEAAIAKAKLKPGVTEARAYARQVKVNGKKYWRVAEDIVRSDKPLTMGEFLRQASPATQTQVLGSEKRRSKFLEFIRGTADRPPVSAERALKMATEWRPTVTRRPRLSAQMRLDISKLKSQRDLMKKNSEGEQHIVYGYLRAKDSGTAKAGTPYYVGIGNKHTRAYVEHVRGNTKSKFRDVPVPKNEVLIRQFGTFPNRAAAAKREQALIARFGRKGIDDKGILLNRTPGGDGGVSGVATRKTARKYGIAIKDWDRLTASQRHSVSARYRKGLRGDDLLSGYLGRPKAARELSESMRLANASRAAKSAARYGLTPEEWSSLSFSKRNALKQYLAANPGVAARDYLSGNYSRLQSTAAGKAHQVKAAKAAAANKRAQAAADFGISLNQYEKMTLRERNAMKTWVKRNPGKTGADYLAHKASGSRQVSTETIRRLKAGADAVGVPFDVWKGLSANQREIVRKRFKRGKRGAALLEGLL